MSKTPNADRVNPNVKVSANQRRNEAESTHGGTQKSEEHFRKIVDKAVNRSDSK